MVKCCICGKEAGKFGHNAYPVMSQGRCCAKCNKRKVIPARMTLGSPEQKAIYKLNIIRLMKEHKDNCNGESCGISLILVMQMAQKAGIVFTRSEIREFL